ncbi:MAG: Acetylornithine transaminase [Frankiales bacterium]|nr:Acetylornithine transaminase [Frankiales bacterium]
MSALLHPFAKPSAAESSFIRMVRGQGAVVWDSNGKRYVDGLASLWYCKVGHGRADIADAVAAQMRTLETYHCFERFSNGPADELAARLAALAPVPGSRVFLTSGGSEAVDTAIKLSRVAHAQAGHPERTIVVSRAPSYHGVTYGAMALTGLPLNRKDFGSGLPDVVQVDKDDVDAVRQVLLDHPGQVAAVFAEPVVGAGGVWPPEPGYLQALRGLCDEHGAHLVLDEVICGFGRLGATFAGSHFGVQADLTTFAKGVTSGYVPLGGVLVAPSVHEPLAADPSFVLRHGYTYSGHAAACTAALVCLDITEREGLLAKATAIGARLEPALQSLQKDGLVADVRGVGALWAVSVPAGVDPVGTRDRMLDLGVVVRPIAPATLAICPPLVIEPGDLDAIPEALRTALS